MFRGDLYLTAYIVLGVVAGILFSKADTQHGGVIPLVVGLAVSLVAYLLVRNARTFIKLLVLALLVAVSMWLYVYWFPVTPEQIDLVR